MIQPNEMKGNLPMEIGNGVISTNTKVWEILTASYTGDIHRVKELVYECPGLIYAQYNYTPPIHFAVREGHIDLVQYLLEEGAHDPSYKIYPFNESLQTIANDRGYTEIVKLLDDYAAEPSRCRFKGDNGNIKFPRTTLQIEFQKCVNEGDLKKVEEILNEHPEFVDDDTYGWGEGIMTVPANKANRSMLQLLIRFGAKVPLLLKWAQAYYFKHFEIAFYLMDQGMSAEVMSWHHVRILHDMAQKGEMIKAALLVRHGAGLNVLEDEYQSTPLGMAARWGRIQMVEYLLEQGADPNKSGASWSTPLAWAQKKGHKEIEKMLLKN